VQLVINHEGTKVGYNTWHNIFLGSEMFKKIGQTGVRQTLEDRKNIGNGGGKKWWCVQKWMGWWKQMRKVFFSSWQCLHRGLTIFYDSNTALFVRTLPVVFFIWCLLLMKSRKTKNKKTLLTFWTDVKGLGRFERGNKNLILLQKN
jgi:hypothetical protein